ncbi:hypothetical protein F4814DRAFT_447547 [Daldinia grandis]|nr:hypothetical protein F4814DRAFT_447547 [Daldinia grandis]
MNNYRPFISTIEASGSLVSPLRVGAPHPAAFPVVTIFPGGFLTNEIALHKPMIEHIVGNVMNGLEFEVEFALVLSRPEIQHPATAFTVLIHAEPNSNMVSGAPWGKHTIYRGSKWLYVVDHVRSYLIREGFGFVTVEMQERGLRRERIDSFVMYDPCFDTRFCDQFNRGECQVYEDVHNICTDDLRVGIHMRDMSIRDVQWVHRLPGGHFHALVMEFDGGLNEELWWPLEWKIRQRLDMDVKNDLRRLPIMFNWRISLD